MLYEGQPFSKSITYDFCSPDGATVYISPKPFIIYSPGGATVSVHLHNRPKFGVTSPSLTRSNRTSLCFQFILSGYYSSPCLLWLWWVLYINKSSKNIRAGAGNRTQVFGLPGHCANHCTTTTCVFSLLMSLCQDYQLVYLWRNSREEWYWSG